MINGEQVLAIIPARGGSKRFPRKNLALFRGSPLVSWAIRVAACSQYIDECVVSTEDAEIKTLALSHGCEVIDRAPELATDEARIEDVLRHVMQNTIWYDWIILLQPTSPLRTAYDIDTCLELAQGHNGCVSLRKSTLKKNGAVYVARARWLLDGNNFDKPFPVDYLMPEERSLDVDFAEQLNTGANCFKCGAKLILQGAYEVCPTHGRQWMPKIRLP